MSRESRHRRDSGGRGWDRVVISENTEVDAALHEFGLSRHELLEVAGAARWARNSGTQWDPPGFAGWNQYAHATRAFRRIMIEDRPPNQKWTKDDDGGLCRTVHPAGTMAVVASSGSSETGHPQRHPKTQYRKGKRSLDGLRTNQSQLELFESDAATTAPMLWFLLIHVGRDGGVTAELSLPLDVDGDGRVDDWLTRVVIRPDPAADTATQHTHDDLDIDVVPRAG